MASTYDAIVIGAGGVGSAALYHLARRGLRVLGLDRFPTGHALGSSHGETRLIRQAYFEHPNYVPLLKRSYQLWASLEQETGAELYRECGILQVGRPDGRVIPGVLASASQHGLEVEALTPKDLRRRFPAFVVHEPLTAVFERHAGFLFVERCVQAHTMLACREGARLHAGETVIGWEFLGNGVRVRTADETYHAAQLVITAGAWASQILNTLRIPLQVVRKSLYWYATDEPAFDVDAGAPGFIYEAPRGNFYGFPKISRKGVKVAEHSNGIPVGDPLRVDRAEDPAETDRIREFLMACMPGVSHRKTAFATCLYTLSPDGNFVVDQWPEAPHVAYAAGLSGHGFKFASVLGEALADLATEGSTNLPIGFLNSSRPELQSR